MESYEFSLVFEAVSERRILMNIAPHLVNPMGFLFPVYKRSRRSTFTINLGMWVYDGLSLFRSPKIHRNLSKKDVQKEEPALEATGLKGAPLYYDCSTDDARLTLETALDAKKNGAVIATYTKVIAFLHGENGRIEGVRIQDQLTGEEKELRANSVINATGPWSDRTRLLGKEDGVTRLRPTKGIHIVVDHSKIPIENAVVCFHPVDGRVLFAIPWGSRTYIGTTDTDFDEDFGEVAASSDDVDYLLEVGNIYFPSANLKREDVISTWAGVRPLIAPEDVVDESSVSREHVISVGADGLITIAGGKLTTYRRMASELIDKTVDWLRLTDSLPTLKKGKDTATEALPGGVGWPDDDDHSKVLEQLMEVCDCDVSKETALYLIQSYGMCAFDVVALAAKEPRLLQPLNEGQPEILAQVQYAIRKEMAFRLSDILIRRTQIFFKERNQGLDCVELVSTEMASVLGWSEEERLLAIEEYRLEVERSRQWQQD